MTNCTWEDCEAKGTHEKCDRNHKTWAVLCDRHHIKLEATFDTMGSKAIVALWIKAQGGSKKAASRMTAGPSQHFLKALQQLATKGVKKR